MATSAAAGPLPLPILSALPIPLPALTLSLGTSTGSTQPSTPTTTTPPAVTPAPAPAATPTAPTPTTPTPSTSGGVTQAILPTCGSTVHPFAQWGDNNSYYAFPNNGFESGAAGWAVSRGSVVTGNEPWLVNGTGSHSLSLSAGGAAASPLVCINLLDPNWRMFARANGANGALHVQVVFVGVTGNLTGVINFTDLQATKYKTWTPSSKISSLLALPLLTKYAQLRVQSTATSGTWQIDDVFVDPWANRA